MFGNVGSVAASNQTFVDEVPALRKGFEALKGVSTEMADQFDVIVPRSGGPAAHSPAITALINAALEISGAVHSYATENGDGELAAKVNYTDTSIIKGGPAKLLSRCRVIAVAAEENLEFLADAKITQAKLTAFGKKIDAAEEAALKPRDNTVRKVRARKELFRLRRKGNTILKGRLDKLMRPFRETQPAFYVEYRAARRIVNSATSHQAPATVTTAATRNGNGNGTTATELVPETTR